MKREDSDKIFNQMYNDASTWRSTWEELRNYVDPTKGNFNNEPNEGIKIDHKVILHNAPSIAARTFASGMLSSLTPPSKEWFKLSLADSDLIKFKPVKEWLDIAQDKMMTIFAKSNVYSALYNMYEEIATFGTTAGILEEDFDDVIRLRPFTIGEFYLSNSEKNKVNGFAREFQMTVAQLVERFGIENVSTAVKTDYENKLYLNFYDVRHLIIKDTKADINAMQMPYLSLYWEVSEPNKYLRKSGYEEFPILAPRWGRARDNSIYGNGSPGWKSLGNIKMLYKQIYDLNVGLAKTINPPMQASSTLIDGTINIFPGGVTKVNSPADTMALRPIYENRLDVGGFASIIERTKDDIRADYFADLFLMLMARENPTMTAREVIERHEEKMIVLAPFVSLLESELLDPLIDRTFNIANRAGIIPPPPVEIQGLELDVEYISILNQVQQMYSVNALVETTAYMAQVAQINPQVVDVIDTDRAVEEYANKRGVPAKVIRTKEELASIRRQRQAAIQQQAENIEETQNVDTAKKLSETKMGTDSALDAITQNVGGQ